MTHPTVFVVHENLHMNFNDAERFGEVQFITNREWNPRRGSLSNAETFASIAQCIKTKYNAERDFLILTGPPVIIGYAFHVAALKSVVDGAGGVRILSWDKREGKYIEGLAESPLAELEKML